MLKVVILRNLSHFYFSQNLPTLQAKLAFSFFFLNFVTAHPTPTQYFGLIFTPEPNLSLPFVKAHPTPTQYFGLIVTAQPNLNCHGMQEIFIHILSQPIVRFSDLIFRIMRSFTELRPCLWQFSIKLFQMKNPYLISIFPKNCY